MRWKSLWLCLVFALCWKTCTSLRGSDLVLQAKAKAAEEKLNPTTEEVLVSEDGNTTVVKKPLLTGIPQKDYIHDPNLPRELKGHNLTNYPFYNAVPEDIEFECDGLHDGFYASVPHHCQVYHHCLFGTRYDFLCANYTAFDQKTFICHFVSEVDCANSPKYYVRNEALYKAASSPPPPTTTTAATTTSTTTTKRPKRRRPNRRRRPVYEYYYDSDEYDDEYYDDEEDPLPPPRKSGRKQRPNQGREKINRRRPQNSRKRPSRYDEDEYEEVDDRPRMRKGNRKADDYKRNRNRKGNHRDDEDDLPERPTRGGPRKRYPEETRNRGERRPATEYEYYDEEEEEEKYERHRPTRKPDKRLRTTTKKYERTTEAAEEDYEEYEDEEEEPKIKKKEDVTTLAPHRFSTSNYKNSKSSTARPTSNRRPKPTEPERKFKPLSKRVESSTEETTTFKRPIVMKPTIFPDRKFTSVVGTPVGFRKQEEKNISPELTTETLKQEEKPEPSRRPFDPSFRKQFSNFRRQQEDEKREDKGKVNTAQNSEEVNPVGGKNAFVAEQDSLNYRSTLSKSQEPIESQSDENVSNPRSPSRESNFNFRKYVNRAPDFTIPPRSEENSSSSNRFKSENVQNGRVYASLTQEADTNNGDPNSRYPQDNVQNGRIYPSRTQEALNSEEGFNSKHEDETVQNGRVYPSGSHESSHSDENSSNVYRNPIRNEEQSFRSNYNRHEVQPNDGASLQFRRPFNHEDRVSNFRNPSAVANNEYRNPSISKGETHTNFRNQPTGSGNVNYRNPHASSDENHFKTIDESQYRVSNINDPYRRPENKWPPKDQAQYLTVEPSPQPSSIEDVKPYLSSPGSDQTQENSDRSSYSAVTSPSRGFRRYTKTKVAVRPKPVTEENVEYNKYPVPEESPKIEFTAPGPSAPQATPRPYINLDDYDVTLNDALQPSTPYSRLKSRGYQPAVTHPSYRTGFLLTAASQAYPTKLSGEYEAVVVPAQRFSTKRRPQEWYW